MLDFWIRLLEFFNLKMETPTPYGWFHLMWLGITAVVTVLLCVFGRNKSPRFVQGLVFGVAAAVALLEVYKQINYTFSVNDGSVTADFQWYAFPWQFCSTPMYVGLLTGLFRKGKVHDALYSYLATYALFAGICVMLYPTSVFVGTIGINIQTMICHGSMIVVGIYLLAAGYVRLEQKTILKALPVFAAAVACAVILNEWAYFSGLLETDTFNMFFISQYCEPSLPVYSLVQGVLPYPWCLVLYVWGFTTASWLILMISMGISRLAVSHKKIPQIA